MNYSHTINQVGACLTKADPAKGQMCDSNLIVGVSINEGALKKIVNINYLKRKTMTGGGGVGYYVPPVRKKLTVYCEKLEVITVLTYLNKELLAALEVGKILTVHVQCSRRAYLCDVW